ncbi:MAG: transposase [Deltaproteobacteria bacterium]|nr:transposase [Deltaproteobacteria bacterium]
MTYDPEKHHRRSIRLKEYDYSQAGAYFVTVCTQNRECLFGGIVDGQMRLTDAGQMVQTTWDELPKHYTGIDIDEFVVMPNHVHGIILIQDVGAGPGACPNKGQPQGVTSTLSLPDVVHRFKSITTTRYRHGVAQKCWSPFPGRLWQRNYYEHIIRNEDDLLDIREYITNNPSRWSEDENNPINFKEGQPQLGQADESPLHILKIKP